MLTQNFAMLLTATSLPQLARSCRYYLFISSSSTSLNVLTHALYISNRGVNHMNMYNNTDTNHIPMSIIHSIACSFKTRVRHVLQEESSLMEYLRNILFVNQDRVVRVKARTNQHTSVTRCLYNTSLSDL